MKKEEIETFEEITGTAIIDILIKNVNMFTNEKYNLEDPLIFDLISGLAVDLLEKGPEFAMNACQKNIVFNQADAYEVMLAIGQTLVEYSQNRIKENNHENSNTNSNILNLTRLCN